MASSLFGSQGQESVLQKMQDADDEDTFEYLGGVVDVKIDAPAALKSQTFMVLQSEEHFSSMAQIKN